MKTDPPPIPLGELLSVAEPRGGINRAIRKAQLDALLRLIPMILGGQVIAAGLLTASILDSVPYQRVLAWWAVLAVLCLWRGTRAWRLRTNAAYVRRAPPNTRTSVKISLVLAAIWWVPPLFFFDLASVPDKIVMMIVTAGLVSVASFTIATIPLAALIQIWLLVAAETFMAVHFNERSLAMLMPVYGAVMSVAVITHARQFINHVRGRLQLQEQGELLSLLQELQASGSGGLWELDGDLRIVNISESLAAAIGKPVEGLVGVPARDVLDPNARIADLSAGMRTLFDHLANGLEFRDLAVLAESGRWWSLSGKPIFANNGLIAGWRGVASDVTALRLTGDDAVRTARIDPLTGVANRLLVRELLEEALLAQLADDGQCALMLVDLDRFKLVNDTLGHAIGDQLLCAVAHRLEATVAEGGRVGRLGGDEFAIVWTGASDVDSLASLATRVIEAVAGNFPIGPANLHVGATIGVARGGVDGYRQELLMRSADLALYRAKEEGRGGFAFYEHRMFVAAEDHRMIENDVRDALNANGFRLVYQSIINVSTGSESGREALLRWKHPTRGDIPPDLFVPIIEDAGLIHQIGDWVIREACAEAASWDKALRIAVNVSAAQLGGTGLAQTVLSALAVSGLAPDRLELEVTESVFLGDDAATLGSLERLRSLGVRLVLDDFGKGYSSFGYLSRAQFSKIKIDQTFVRGAAQGVRENIAILQAILALSRGLGVATTAEGVETEEQAEAMCALGCTELQGFYFGRPVPAEALPRARRRRRA